jgi:hypothetical protein
VPRAASLRQLFSHPKHRHAAPERDFSRSILVDFRPEDQDGMCATLRVRWTITPKIAPQPWLTCSRCGKLRAFQTSCKIRLNANGRKLDAWLIYKCVVCEKTWNRPIFERRNVGEIGSAELEALQSNDPQWIRAEAFNLDALRRRSQRIDEFPEFEIRKHVLAESPAWTRVEIEVMVPLPTNVRLDRLLALELGLPRPKLRALHDAGTLQVSGNRSDVLGRRVKNGVVVIVDLVPLSGSIEAWRQASTGSMQ